MATRRSFLKALGMGSAAAPLAAKAAFEKETLALSAGTQQLAAGALSSLGAPQSINDEANVRIKMAKHIRLFGLPKHVLQQIEQEAKWVSSLDFDIANKRSWSLAAKVHEQRQRNLKRKLELLRNGGVVAEAKRMFRKTFGFEFLPW